ncbi:MAG: hypothetical protein V4858_17100 [Pseudomonadota bacterium]
MQDKLLSFVQTRSRSTDCDTSKAAAKAAVSRKADRERAAIAECVKAAPGGLTAREVANLTGLDYIEVQRRISECGLKKTDRRRDGCAVWSASA